MSNSLSLLLKRDQQQGYKDLPDAIKLEISPIEWAWLSDQQKATLQDDLTNPESPE